MTGWVIITLSCRQVCQSVPVMAMGHGMVMQYISPDLYFLCLKYLRFSTISFHIRSKSCCGGSNNREHSYSRPGWLYDIILCLSCSRYQQTLLKTELEESENRPNCLQQFIGKLCGVAYGYRKSISDGQTDRQTDRQKCSKSCLVAAKKNFCQIVSAIFGWDVS